MAILISYTIDDERFYGAFMCEKVYRDQLATENWVKIEIAEGKAKGYAEGHAESLAEGAQKTLLQNIKGLLKFGMDENSIKKAFNCTDEQIIEAKTNYWEAIYSS